MAWPLNQDYNEAIQDPRSCLSDPELRDGEAVCNALGLPRPRSGNFADVYEVNCPASGGRYAVKCFTREVRGLQARYQAISEHLHQAKLPFTVDFKYLDKGIQIRGQWYPILKMQWVEGLTLNEFVRQHLDRPAMLDGLLQIWTRMAKRLREANLAHADLQHGNVLLVPGSTASSLAVKLIDYDGMHVPALAGKQSGEVGHPAYQHPQRLREGTYNAEVDRFPLLVISAALRCLMAGGRDLWERYDTGDNLLFRETDLRQPDSSDLFEELRRLKDPLALDLVNRVAAAVPLPLEQAPLLEELFPERKATPARAAAKGKQGIVEKKPGEVARSSPPTTIQNEPNAVGAAPEAWSGLEQTELSGRRLRKEPAKRAFPLIPVAVGGGGAGLALVALLAWALWPATPKKPVDNRVAQVATTENPKPNLILVPPRDKDKKERPPEPVRPPVNPPIQPPVNPPPIDPMPMPAVPGPFNVTSNQFRLPSPVLAVALSRDGQRVALGGANGLIHTGLVTDKGPLKVLKAHTGEVLGLAFLSDGQTLVSAGQDGALKWWNLDTGTETRSVVGHPGGIACLALSPDGQLLATGSKLGQAKIWDLTGTVKAVLTWQQTKPVNGVAFSPDSQWLATACEDGSLRQWDTKTGHGTGRPVRRLGSPLTAVTYNPDGQALVVADRNRHLSQWSATANETRILPRAPGAVNALAYSPDGKYLAVDGADGVPYLLKVPGFLEKVALGLHQGEIKALAFAATGATLVVGGSDNRAAVWNIPKMGDVAVKPDPLPVPNPQDPQGTLVFRDRATLPGDPNGVPLNTLWFSPDSAYLVSVTSGNPRTLVWDLKTSQMRIFKSWGRGLAISPNGKWLVGWDSNQDARLADFATGQEKALLPSSKGQIGCRFSPDNNQLVSVDGSGSLRIWDVPTGRETQAFPSPVAAKIQTLSPIGTNQLGVVVGNNGWLQPWDLAAGKPLKAFQVSKDLFLKGLALSADGKLCAICEGPFTVRLWDVETGQLVRTLSSSSFSARQMWTAYERYSMQLVFRPDGKVLFGLYPSGLIICWDVVSGQELARGTLPRELDVMNMNLCLSPDCTTLAYGVKGQLTIYLTDVQGPGVPAKP